MARADLAGVGQRPPGSPAVDVRGDAVQVWPVQVGLADLPRCAGVSQPLTEGSSVPRTGRCRAGVGDRGRGRIGGASNPAGEHQGRAARRSHCYRRGAAATSMRSMSTKSATQDGAVPPAVPPQTPADPAGNADASPPAFPEQIYEQATARLAVIIEEWHKARDACLRG